VAQAALDRRQLRHDNAVIIRSVRFGIGQVDALAAQRDAAAVVDRLGKARRRKEIWTGGDQRREDTRLDAERDRLLATIERARLALDAVQPGQGQRTQTRVIYAPADVVALPEVPGLETLPPCSFCMGDVPAIGCACSPPLTPIVAATGAQLPELHRAVRERDEPAVRAALNSIRLAGKATT
jgi:hypothetical protein